MNDKTKHHRSGLEENGVGKLRQQSALCDSDRRVVLVASCMDPDIAEILSKLEVVCFYPDTTDENHSFDESTFKIEVGRKKAK